MTFYFREEYDKGIEYCQKALEVDSNFLAANLWQASCHFAMGNHEKAIELLKEYLPKMHTQTRVDLGLAGAYGLAGRKEQAERYMAKVAQAPDREQIPPIAYAGAYGGLGDADKMFEYLDKAAIVKDYSVPMALIDPMDKRYWTDPRYTTLKAKVGI
jgi:tetratricopeptide (TPR) repeat protein